MTQFSPYGYVVRGLHHDATGPVLRADFPVSTNHAQYIMNNAQHLSDMSTQYRVNWVAQTLAKGFWVNPAVADTYEHIVTFAFLCSYNVRGGYPDGLVVRVAGAVTEEGSSGPTLTLMACLQPYGKPIGLDDTVAPIAYLDGSTTSATGTVWVIEGEMSGQYNETTPALLGTGKLANLPMYTEADSTTTARVEPLAMRLSIYGKCDLISQVTMRVTGCLVREYRKEITS